MCPNRIILLKNIIICSHSYKCNTSQIIFQITQVAFLHTCSTLILSTKHYQFQIWLFEELKITNKLKNWLVAFVTGYKNIVIPWQINIGSDNLACVWHLLYAKVSLLTWHWLSYNINKYLFIYLFNFLWITGYYGHYWEKRKF